MKVNDNIKFWLPVEIQKGFNEQGTEIMKLGGIASTIDKDFDGESLDPSGFDVTPLLQSGIVNWHHQVKGQPKTIIGEPTKAEIKPEGLYIETELYPSSQIAKDVWELAQTLQKDSKTRRLGYSIEGKVLKRKSDDPKSPDFKKILKASITGVAITHQPKNPKTFANIIKGEVDNDDIDDEVEETEEIEKEMNTENGAALKKESVNKDMKTSLTKSQVLEILFFDNPDLSIEKGEQIYKLITKISVMKNKKSISTEDIEKAYELLGVDNIKKAKESSDETPEVVEEDKDGDEGKKESKKEQKEAEESSDDNSVEKAETPEIGSNFSERFDGIEKAIMTSNKNTNEFIKAVGVLVKDTRNAIQKSEEREEQLLDIIKAQGESLDILKGQIEEIGNFTPAPKSIKSAQVMERNFSKGEENELKEDSNATLSISKNKRAIVEILDQACFAKGYDAQFGKACTQFESSNVIMPDVINRLKNEFNINIVK